MEEDKRKALAERYTYLQIILENFIKQRELILKNLEEIEETLEAIQNLKKEMEVIFSIGGNVFGFGKITSDKFLVNVGYNVGVEFEKNKALEILERNKDSLIKNLNEIEENINKIVSEQQKILNLIQNKE